jgi:protein disulfide-isomerase A1
VLTIQLVYFGTESDESFKAHEAVASGNDKVTFVHLDDTVLAKELTGKDQPAAVLFRKFDQPTVVFNGEFKKETLKEFLDANSVPTLIEFSDEYVDAIFSQQKSALFLFRDVKSEKGAALEKQFGEIAKDHKGKILFSVSDVKEGIQNRLSEYVGVPENKMPLLMIVAPGPEGISKYMFETPLESLSSAVVGEFLQDFKDGKLKKYFKSEAAPESNDGPVKVVVASTFSEIVFSPESDVLIEFYAPWCGHCKKLEPIYNELGEKVKDIKGLVIAKMDATANEVTGVDVQGFPTLKFYPKGAKHDPQAVEVDRTLEGLTGFLEKNSELYKASTGAPKTDL